MTEPRPVYTTDIDLTADGLLSAIDRALGRNQPTVIPGFVVESDSPAEPWRVDVGAGEVDLIDLIDEHRGLWSPVLVEALADAPTND